MKLVPSNITSTRFSQPWVTRTCQCYSRRKKRTYNRAKRTGIQSDRDIFKTVTKELQAIYKQACIKYLRDCISPDIKNNPKTFFSFIKSRKCENTGIAPMRDKNCKVHIDDKAKAVLL